MKNNYKTYIVIAVISSILNILFTFLTNHVPESKAIGIIIIPILPGMLMHALFTGDIHLTGNIIFISTLETAAF